MAFNFFKKKKQEESQPKADQPLAEKQEQAKDEKETLAPKKRTKSKLVFSNVLLNPHITEKATLLKEQGQYVFKVELGATKGAVKQSVEALYGVLVKNVRLIKKPAKKIRIGRREGIKPGLKKAVVQLKQGENIETLSR